MPNAGIVLGACSRSLYLDEVTYTNWEITQTFKVYKETLPYLTISPNLFTSPDEHCGGHYNQTIEVLDGASNVYIGAFDVITDSQNIEFPYLEARVGSKIKTKIYGHLNFCEQYEEATADFELDFIIDTIWKEDNIGLKLEFIDPNDKIITVPQSQKIEGLTEFSVD